MKTPPGKSPAAAVPDIPPSLPPFIPSDRLERTFHLLGILWLGLLACLSEGVALHDELGHFLISQKAWSNPLWMLDLWGRPVNTILFMPFAWGGLLFARVNAILMTLVTALLTGYIAALMPGNIRRAAVGLFWLQPWTLAYGYGVHTELPFMLLLTLAFLSFIRHKPLSLAMICGLLPLARHEGILFTGLAVLYLIYLRQWFWLWLPFLPLAGYNLIHFAALNYWPFEIFLNAKPTELYGSKGWLHFVPRAGIRIGLPVFAAMMIGSYAAWRQREKPYLLFMVAAIYVMAHVVILRFGLFATGGYAIFLWPIAPATAILAARGWHFIQNMPRFQHRRSLITSLLLCLLFASALPFALPVQMDREGRLMKETVQWLKVNHYDPAQVYGSHVWLYYLYPLPWSHSRFWDNSPPPEQIPTGSLYIWDDHYSDRYGFDPTTMKSDHWELVRQWESGRVIAYRKVR